MGWKASIILINERGPGYFGKKLTHVPERARKLIDDLGLGPCRSRGMTTFDEGIYPDHLVVGAYDSAAFIGAPQIIGSSLSLGDDPLMRRVLGCFPQSAVLRVGLHSVVNLWSYEYFEGGRLLRAYGGSADDGVMADEGDWLPEERPHFERSVVRDGRRFFNAEVSGQMEEFDASAYGETLTFEMMGRFFGCRPDQSVSGMDLLELPMESFDRRKSWWPFKRVSFVEEGNQRRPTSETCLVCGEKLDGNHQSRDSLCPPCGRLLDWFRGHFTQEKGLPLFTITAETTFLDLAVDSLDYVEWVIEAEEQFKIQISDEDVEKLKTVGDYLSHIRAKMEGKKSSEGWPPRSSGGSNPMWDRKMDA